jgi:hypothetical protein
MRHTTHISARRAKALVTETRRATFASETPVRWRTAIHSVHRGLVNPSTGASPGLKTSPRPSARFRA